MEIVEKKKKTSSKIEIRPYVDKEVPNMGLETYDMVLFEGAKQTFEIACVETNGIPRYITGLNEFAPEVQNIKDPEVRRAKIQDIRERVSYIEKVLAANDISVDDPKFWEKVKVLSPSNREHWGNVTLTVSNRPMELDPKDPSHLILISAIEAGGFPEVAKSREDAKYAYRNVKFYMDRFEEEVSSRIEVKRLRNKALVALEKMFQKDVSQLFYIVKELCPNGATYTKRTDHNVLYEDMDKYIKGEGGERSERKAAQEFLDAAARPLGESKIKAILKDAAFYKFAIVKNDGLIYHTKSGSPMGHNIAECIEFMTNPLHVSVSDALMKEVEAIWQRA